MLRSVFRFVSPMLFGLFGLCVLSVMPGCEEEETTSASGEEPAVSVLAGQGCYAACVDGLPNYFCIGGVADGHCIDAAKTYCANKGYPFEDAAWGKSCQ